MKNTVMVVGSSLNDKGGIVTVMKNIEGSELNKKYQFIHIDTYDTCSALKKIYIFILGVFKIVYMMFVREINLIHIHMSYKGSFYRKSIVVLIAKLFKRPVVIHMHGSCFKEFYNSLGDLQKKYCNYIFNKSDKVIVLSESWKEFFSLFVESKKIVVVKNSVPIIKKQVEVNKIKKDKITFLFMGRLGKRKGVYDLIEVADKVLSQEKYKDRFRLILAGDGEIDKVDSMIKERNLEKNILNYGWVNGKQKEKLLLDSDVFILPSYNEGLPMAILEAMSYNLVCISTNVGGIPEVIKNGYNGYISNAGDNEALYNNIIKVLENEDIRLSMSKNAFNTVYKEFNQQIEINKIDEVYKMLIMQR